MSWSPEEESFAAEFLRKVQYGTKTVSHDQKQLHHLETQIGNTQASLTGEGPKQVFSYNVKDVRLPHLFGRRINQVVNKQFLQGMVTTAKYLRRNIPG